MPSAFVFLDSLPLTPSGKVDRRALPAPNHDPPASADVFVAPRTSTERMIAGIWAEVLGVKQIGIHDNFFDLGGHSLLATQVVSRMQEAFHVKLPLRGLFEKPTIEGLAMIITRNQAEKSGAEELTDMLARIESLSDADAQRLLAQKTKRQL